MASANVHEEKWGPFGRSWSVEPYNIDMLTPRYSHLIAVPLAWSSPTGGSKTGEVLYAPFGGRRYDLDLKRVREDIEQYKTQWRGKLKGKIVLLTDAKQPAPSTRPIFSRLTDGELADIGKGPAPAIRRNITVEQVDIPKDEEEARKYLATLPDPVIDELYDKYDDSESGLGACF